jgi:iron(III) transport system substrate-binding protein
MRNIALPYSKLSRPLRHRESRTPHSKPRGGIADTLLCISGVLLAIAGCVPRAENEVVVYTALDQEFSAPIYAAFHRSTDGEILPAAKFDVESTKTVGLVNQIIAERDRPVADVFWNNEILHTIRLQRMGLLQPHKWKLESGYPEQMRAEDGTW